VEATQRIKAEVLTYYGGGKLACAVCGESRLPCLSLDHLNNDGSKERRELGIKTSRVLYYRLRKWEYPEGYMTLCMNCQYIKRYQWYQEKQCVL